MSAATPISARVSRIGLAVPDPTEVADFYCRVVGLHQRDSNEEVMRLGLGFGAPALELSSGNGLDHFALELSSETALGELLESLDRREVEVDLASKGQDGEEEGAAVNDPDGNRVVLHGPIARSGEHIADPGRRPIRLHHVTLGSPDVARMVDFYTAVLGFRISDRMGEAFVWMRSNREHHSVAVVEADEPGLDHFCFEVADWAALKIWCDELAVRDVPITWGPGRHGPGNNLFIMFDDPAENRIEFSCEMERYWDDLAEYAPREWRPGVKTINLWGVAPSWRERVAP